MRYALTALLCATLAAPAFAVEGITTAVHLTSDAICSVCHGSGAEPGSHPLTCPTCNGRGVVDDRFPEDTAADEPVPLFVVPPGRAGWSDEFDPPTGTESIRPLVATGARGPWETRLGRNSGRAKGPGRL